MTIWTFGARYCLLAWILKPQVSAFDGGGWHPVNWAMRTKPEGLPASTKRVALSNESVATLNIAKNPVEPPAPKRHSYERVPWGSTSGPGTTRCPAERSTVTDVGLTTTCSPGTDLKALVLQPTNNVVKHKHAKRCRIRVTKFYLTPQRSAAAYRTRCGRTGDVRQRGARLPRTGMRCPQQCAVR
jgi:hypothetical protein